MRVLCIDADAYPKDLPIEDEGIIQNGNIYTVIDVYFADNYIWYEIEEDPNGGYWENCFARTSDIDETEMIREQLTETA